MEEKTIHEEFSIIFCTLLWRGDLFLIDERLYTYSLNFNENTQNILSY